MRYRKTVLCLVLALLLTGCEIVPDTYVSVSPHEDSYAQSSGEQEFVVNNYAELHDAVYELIRNGTEEATLTTDVYSGDLDEDFGRLKTYVTHDDPECAYLIRTIDWVITRVGSYYKIDLELHYRHKNAELQDIKTALSMDDVQKQLKEALENSWDRLLLHVYNYSDRDFGQLAKEYAQSHMTKVIAEPIWVLKDTYPRDGSERVLELRFVYPYKSETLKSFQIVVDIMIQAAKDSVIDEPSDLERARQLYTSQISGHVYSEETAQTPAYSLFIDRTGDSRVFSAVYQAMCEEAGVKCLLVHGTKDGEPYDWNILDLDSGVWHVDVNADAQSGAPELRLLTDAEMESYEWDTEAYPPCVGLYAPAEPPEGENAPAADGEQLPEGTEGEQPAQPDDTPEPPEEENPEEPENNA